MTKIINLVAGPGVGKTTIAALLFGEMKLQHCNVEYVQEYAKHLVWMKEFELLNNQHHVSNHQYKLFKSMNNVVDYIVTDGSLLHGLYYNRYVDTNVSNIEKTEKAILDWYNEFDNIVIFLERQNFAYETAGRIQTYEEAIEIDKALITILKNLNIKHFTLPSAPNSVKGILDIINGKTNINQ
jgi:adenylate kinase family enzyme